MSQIRNKTGVKFEKEVCKLYGWEHKTSSPKINWNGSGRNNFQKLRILILMQVYLTHWLSQT
jgi:hypothetical protein